jgi:hypothetical protein
VKAGPGRTSNARPRGGRRPRRGRPIATLVLLLVLLAIAIAGGLLSAAAPEVPAWLIVLVLALLSGPVAGALAWLRRDP